MWLVKLQQYKKALAIIFGLILLGLVWIILSSRGPKPQAPEEKVSTEEKKFQLVATEPELLSGIFYGPSLQVTLIFNEPVSLSTLSYSLAPEVDIAPEPFLGGRQIILRPRKFWPEGDYKLTVYKQTASLTRKTLERDYYYQFTVGYDPRGAD